MGIDYRFQGSSSYPRFNKEISQIAELFGGVKNERYKAEEQNVKTNSVLYWLGFPYISDKAEKYIFPKSSKVPSVFKKWINNPYEELNGKETEKIYNVLLTKRTEVQAISGQIYKEFEDLVEYGMSWYVI